MPEAPGKYQTGFLSLLPAWDWKEPPGKYHPRGCNVWLSPPSHNIFLLGTVAGFLTEVQRFEFHMLRFSDSCAISSISFCFL